MFVVLNYSHISVSCLLASLCIQEEVGNYRKVQLQGVYYRMIIIIIIILVININKRCRRVRSTYLFSFLCFLFTCQFVYTGGGWEIQESATSRCLLSYDNNNNYYYFSYKYKQMLQTCS